jgi:predicted GNAT family acetyltransferase
MQKGEDTVAPIPPEQLPAVEELLRSGNPRTVVRSDAPGIHQWYGIWHGDELVACGADRSFGQVGYLAAVTVSPGARRKGLGASLTSAMARKLLSDTGSVALGVNVANDGAIQLYEKLGFKDVVEVATFEVTA